MRKVWLSYAPLSERRVSALPTESSTAVSESCVKERRSRRRSFTFFDDRLRDYVYARWLPSETRKELHSHASAVLHAQDSPAYAIWHALRAAEIPSDPLSGSPSVRDSQILEAFGSLMHHAPLLSAGYKRSQLLKTAHPVFEARCGNKQAKSWDQSVRSQNRTWYINQGKLAEILYYGFSLVSVVPRVQNGPVDIRKQDEWELIQDALANLRDEALSYAPNSENPKIQEWIVDTYARCLMLQAIFVFEKNAPENHGLPISLSPRPNEWLAEQAGEVLTLFTRLNGSEGGNTPPLASVTACLQACYYNGGKLLPQAIDSFRKAARILDAYERCLTSCTGQSALGSEEFARAGFRTPGRASSVIASILRTVGPVRAFFSKGRILLWTPRHLRQAWKVFHRWNAFRSS